MSSPEGNDQFNDDGFNESALNVFRGFLVVDACEGDVESELPQERISTNIVKKHPAFKPGERRDPEKTRRDIEYDKFHKTAEDIVKKLETGLVPPGMELEMEEANHKHLLKDLNNSKKKIFDENIDKSKSLERRSFERNDYPLARRYSPKEVMLRSKDTERLPRQGLGRDLEAEIAPESYRIVHHHSSRIIRKSMEIDDYYSNRRSPKVLDRRRDDHPHVDDYRFIHHRSPSDVKKKRLLPESRHTSSRYTSYDKKITDMKESYNPECYSSREYSRKDTYRHSRSPIRYKSPRERILSRSQEKELLKLRRKSRSPKGISRSPFLGHSSKTHRNDRSRSRSPTLSKRREKSNERFLKALIACSGVQQKTHAEKSHLPNISVNSASIETPPIIPVGFPLPPCEYPIAPPPIQPTIVNPEEPMFVHPMINEVEVPPPQYLLNAQQMIPPLEQVYFPPAPMIQPPPPQFFPPPEHQFVVPNPEPEQLNIPVASVPPPEKLSRIVPHRKREVLLRCEKAVRDLEALHYANRLVYPPNQYLCMTPNNKEYASPLKKQPHTVYKFTSKPTSAGSLLLSAILSTLNHQKNEVFAFSKDSCSFKNMATQTDMFECDSCIFRKSSETVDKGTMTKVIMQRSTTSQTDNDQEVTVKTYSKQLEQPEYVSLSHMTPAQILIAELTAKAKNVQRSTIEAIKKQNYYEESSGAPVNQFNMNPAMQGNRGERSASAYKNNSDGFMSSYGNITGTSSVYVESGNQETSAYSNFPNEDRRGDSMQTQNMGNHGNSFLNTKQQWSKRIPNTRESRRKRKNKNRNMNPKANI